MEEEAKKEGCEPQERDICFIITPIGDEGSVTRKKTDGLIDNVLEPVCNELGMRAVPAHNIDKIGSITNQVVQHVLDSKMVIANLTGLNPNVMYELAIRHAIRKPIVCIAEHGTKLPFDITTERTIFYSDDMYGATRLRSELRDKLQAALSDKEVDNPIYRAKTESMIVKDIQSSPQNGNSDSLLYILQRLDNIESAIKRNIDSNYKGNIIQSLDEEISTTKYIVYSMILSKPCTENVKSELIAYLDAHVHGVITDYKIYENKILLWARTNCTQYIRRLQDILKEKFQIEVLVTRRLNSVSDNDFTFKR